MNSCGREGERGDEVKTEEEENLETIAVHLHARILPVGVRGRGRGKGGGRKGTEDDPSWEDRKENAVAS